VESRRLARDKVVGGYTRYADARTRRDFSSLRSSLTALAQLTRRGCVYSTAQTLVQTVPCIRLAKIVNMAASLEKTVEEHELHEEDEQDEEKAFLAHELAEHKAYPQKIIPPGLSRRFWVYAAINTLSTAGIVSLLVAHSYM
jgi:hypothetical protein